ncbi:MAG TPA: hypothetical protein G4O02_03710 [Caldilineae bacterium]|nr:hypothetical protein [Caldilineae bacterium]
MMREQPLGYWEVLRKRLWIVALLFVVTMSVIGYSALTAKPIYRASVRLQVLLVEPEEVTLFAQIRNVTLADQIIATQEDFISVATSDLVALRTIARLDLDISASELLDRVTVTRDGEFITVSVEGDTPQQAEAIATALVENALEYYREIRARPAVASGQFIQQQLEQAKQELAAAQNALLKFKLQNNVGSLDREIQAYQDKIRALRDKRDDALIAARQAEALKAEYETLAQSMKEAADAAAQRVAAAREAEDEDALRRALDDEAYYRQKARDYQALAAAQAVAAASHRVAAAEYEQLAARRDADLAALLGLTAEYEELQMAVDQARSNYEFLQGKAREAALKQRQALSLGYLQVVEPARPPQRPAPSRFKRIALVGAVLSLLAGGVLAFLLEFIETLRRPAKHRAPLAG